jgi:RNA polymerase sigma factor (TIGR02999 family)
MPLILTTMDEVTRLLEAIDGGDPHAARQLLPMVYDELRRLGAQKMRREKPGQTLSATALVHEAYVRLVDRGQDLHWSGRGHFFAAAAEAMRRILVEHARHKAALKCGGGQIRHELHEAQLIIDGPREDLVALDEALEKLARLDSAKAELIKLRYFAGLTVEQAAQSLGISATTAERRWAYARAWLLREIRGSGATSAEQASRKEK